MSIKSPKIIDIQNNLHDLDLFKDIPKLNSVKDKRKLTILYEINRIIALLRIIEKKKIEINKITNNKKSEIIKEINTYIDVCINEYKTLYEYSIYLWKNNKIHNIKFEKFKTYIIKLEEFITDKVMFNHNIFNNNNNNNITIKEDIFTPILHCTNYIGQIIEYLNQLNTNTTKPNNILTK